MRRMLVSRLGDPKSLNFPKSERQFDSVLSSIRHAIRSRVPTAGALVQYLEELEHQRITGSVLKKQEDASSPANELTIDDQAR